MKKYLLALVILGAIVAGCVPGKDPLAKQAVTDSKPLFPYSEMENLSEAHDSGGNLAGYLVTGTDADCAGSSCKVEASFIKDGGKGLEIKRVPNLDGNSETVFANINKTLYRSGYQWLPGESHFGCHTFWIEKIKYENNEFSIAGRQTTQNKYSLDPDEGSDCELFPGINEVINAEKLFM